MLERYLDVLDPDPRQVCEKCAICTVQPQIFRTNCTRLNLIYFTGRGEFVRVVQKASGAFQILCRLLRLLELARPHKCYEMTFGYCSVYQFSRIGDLMQNYQHLHFGKFDFRTSMIQISEAKAWNYSR